MKKTYSSHFFPIFRIFLLTGKGRETMRPPGPSQRWHMEQIEANIWVTGLSLFFFFLKKSRKGKQEMDSSAKHKKKKANSGQRQKRQKMDQMQNRNQEDEDRRQHKKRQHRKERWGKTEKDRKRTARICKDLGSGRLAKKEGCHPLRGDQGAKERRRNGRKKGKTDGRWKWPIDQILEPRERSS